MAQLFVKDPWDCSFTYIAQLNQSGKGSEKNSLCILLKPIHLIYLDTLQLSPLCGKPRGLLKQLNLCCVVVFLTMYENNLCLEAKRKAKVTQLSSGSAVWMFQVKISCIYSVLDYPEKSVIWKKNLIVLELIVKIIYLKTN